MNTYRVVAEFAENNGATFEEVYYTDDSNPTNAAKWGPSLIKARLLLLHPLDTLVRIRASQVDAARVTAVNITNLPGTSSPPAFGGPLPVGAAVVCTLTGTTGKSRKLWLRGCTAVDFQRDQTTGKDFPTPTLLAKLQGFFNALKSNSYGIRILKPPSGGVFSKFSIVSVDGQTVPGQSTLTVQNGGLWPTNTRILIGLASKKDLPALNGQWTIGNGVGNFITIPYRTPRDTIVPGGIAYVRSALYNATDVFDPSRCRFDHMGTRTSKNPLSRSRGARRAARIRSLA